MQRYNAISAMFGILAVAYALSPKEAHAFFQHFGTLCEEVYDYGWEDTLHYAWETCEGFNDRMDDAEMMDFYYNLDNAKPLFETTNDTNGADSVVLFFTMTHGSITSSDARWSMRNHNTYAYSSLMRLGDEWTSIMANMSCKLLHTADNRFWTRWDSIFAGGLYYATGSHDIIWDGFLLDENGEYFADELIAGSTVKYAWRDALYDWWEDQDIAVAATGATASDCHHRRDTISWANYPTRLQDGQIGYWCQTQWTDY